MCLGLHRLSNNSFQESLFLKIPLFDLISHCSPEFIFTFSISSHSCQLGFFFKFYFYQQQFLEFNNLRLWFTGEHSGFTGSNYDLQPHHENILDKLWFPCQVSLQSSWVERKGCVWHKCGELGQQGHFGGSILQDVELCASSITEL